MSPPGKWLTCAPRDFVGNEVFFARDTGLFCRGFAACGVPCRAILTGPPRPDDCPDLDRVPLEDLVRRAWWRSQQAAGVVLQTWSDPALTPVVEAIRAAGCHLVLIQDGSGVTGPLSGWTDWVRETWYMRHRHGAAGIFWFVAAMAWGHTFRLAGFERQRLRQFSLASRITAPAPPAVERYRALARRGGGPALAEKVVLLPHPAAPWFQDSGLLRQPRIAAVARWDDFWQKRPDLLIAALDRFLPARPGWSVDLFGDPDASIASWHAALPADQASRVVLHGRVSSRQLAVHLQTISILFFSSAYEGAPISAAEALCSGASVVSHGGPMMASCRWYVSENSGTLASSLSGESLAAALATEADHWQQGRRDPAAISRIWSARLQAACVVDSLLRFFPE